MEEHLGQDDCYRTSGNGNKINKSVSKQTQNIFNTKSFNTSNTSSKSVEVSFSKYNSISDDDNTQESYEYVYPEYKHMCMDMILCSSFRNFVKNGVSLNKGIASCGFSLKANSVLYVFVFKIL